MEEEIKELVKLTRLTKEEIEQDLDDRGYNGQPLKQFLSKSVFDRRMDDISNREFKKYIPEVATEETFEDNVDKIDTLGDKYRVNVWDMTLEDFRTWYKFKDEITPELIKETGLTKMEIVKDLNDRFYNGESLTTFLTKPVMLRKMDDISNRELKKYIPEIACEESYEENIEHLTNTYGDNIWGMTLGEFVAFANKIPPPPEPVEVKPFRTKEESERLLAKLALENARLKAENNELRKKALREIVEEANNRIAFNRVTDIEQSYNYTGTDLDKPATYKEWKALNTDSHQRELVEDRYEKFIADPYKNAFSFVGLNNEGKKIAFPWLREWLTSTVGQAAMTKRYKFAFSVNGKWHRKPLTPELYASMKEKFTEESLLYSIDKTFKDYISDPAITDLPDWSLFDAISLVPVNKTGRDSINGDFFPYRNKTIFDLESCQIYETILDKSGKRQRKELDDCCFIAAIKDFKDEAELNTMRLRINNRNLSQKNVRELCEEFDIKLSIRVIK